MTKDLSRYHHPITDLFATNDPERYRLTEDQMSFYRVNGYLAGVKVLNHRQLDALRDELAELVDPAHPGHELFYEFNANESADPSKILFHALGAWRIKPGLHDLLWHAAFVVPAAQLLGGAVRFWHDQIFYKPAHHGGVVVGGQAHEEVPVACRQAGHQRPQRRRAPLGGAPAARRHRRRPADEMADHIVGLEAGGLWPDPACRSLCRRPIGRGLR